MERGLKLTQMEELINQLKSLQDGFNAKLKDIKDEYLDDPNGVVILVNLQGEIGFRLDLDIIKYYKR